jgi:hypothetical protein
MFCSVDLLRDPRVYPKLEPDEVTDWGPYKALRPYIMRKKRYSERLGPTQWDPFKSLGVQAKARGRTTLSPLTPISNTSKRF